MEVQFDPIEGKPFSIEVGFYETVFEIKEKIQNHHNIPVSKQTLIFNDNILKDELNVLDTHLREKSRIQLLFTSVSDPPSETNHHKQVQPTSPPKKDIQILVKWKLANNNSILAVEIDPDDTIRMLKDKICGLIEGLNNNNNGVLCVHANGVELQDQRTIRDCELSDSSEIDVNFRIRSSSTVPGGSSSASASANNGSGRVKVQILVNGAGKRINIPMEVNYLENVGELKKQLELLHLNLPPEGYFFIHKQNVMDDDRSFKWHHVGQGDILEIFSGTISGGLM